MRDGIDLSGSARDLTRRLFAMSNDHVHPTMQEILEIMAPPKSAERLIIDNMKAGEENQEVMDHVMATCCGSHGRAVVFYEGPACPYCELLATIINGFDYDPGHSDLDDEQPIHVSMTLGDYRKAMRGLR